ncbi:hypothetical protein [uncultured Chitinophaga sp.]|uniref:hypothetical protein n=1 Tax=uncultured Chitinophaga sp. TaxID=339340 RepID=UPI0025D1FE75|nr:hypothetical protein [uncultured Chitinophaga sp.]
MTENLISFNDGDFYDLISARYVQKGGVYKIIAVRDGRRVPINRFLGTDNEGILYIGKATSFIDRVVNLKKSISPNYNGTGHICGRRYKSNPSIAKLFPYDILYTELIETDTPEKVEKRLLREYLTIYGEVPPLNAI